MRLVFAGTGGFHPNERRHTASLLLPEIGVALDAGTGFFRVPRLMQTPELDVFLTHAHLDHVFGLTCLLVPMLNGQIRAVRLHGTEATLQAVQTHLFAKELFPVLPSFDWCPLSGDGLDVGGARLRWQSLMHPGGSTAYRFDWPDRSLAYVTDTTAPGSYASFVQGVSLLVHECYFPDELTQWAEPTGHSAATPVARLAQSASVKRLILVHVDPLRADDDPVGLSVIRDIFPNSTVADDLLVTEF